MRRGAALAALAVAAIGFQSNAIAQSESGRDRLIDLATIEIAHQLCGFDLSDAQQSAINAQRNKMLDDGDVTDADISDTQDSLLAAMTRQVPEGLCKAGGAGERLYKRGVASLGAE